MEFNIEFFAITIVFAILLYIIFKEISDYKWSKRPLQNFPFKYRGKEFWYSRSVAVVGAVFAKNENDKWCILANRRGEGTPDFQGYWNVPCGYLDHDETTSEAVSREVLEETGVFIPNEKFQFYKLMDSPKENRQNISIRYFTKLDEKCETFTFSTEKSEVNEVSEIKWIPLDEVENYQWAFNHLKLINDLKTDVIG